MSPANTQPRSAQTSASPVEARSPSEAQRGATNSKGRQHARGETGALGSGTRRPGCRSMGAGPVHTRTHPGSCVARLGCAPPSARGWRAWVGGLPLPVPVLTSQLGNPSKSAHLWPRSSSARGRGPGARGGVESGHVNQPADAPVLGWRSKTGRGRGGGGGAGSWRPDTGLRSKPTPPPPLRVSVESQ